MMFDLAPEEARLLLKIAMMAIGRNRFGSAARILAVLERFRPSEPSIAAAKALALISALKFAEAVEFIDREGLVKFPGSAMLQAFKGMAYVRLQRPQDAREPLELAVRGDDPAAARLAGDLLADLGR